jgi:hypothetical protein
MSEETKADGQVPLTPPPSFPSFPKDYRSFNSPERAYPRPMRQPLFDAEWLLPGKPCGKLNMFRTPVEGRFYYGDDHKGRSHTNLYQAGTILFPLEFSILGFNYATNEDISPEDHAKITSGLFTFTFSGRRPYADIPLIRMPSERRRRVVGDVIARIEKVEAALKAGDIKLCGDQYREDIAQLRKEIDEGKIYNFTIGKLALKIKPEETFGVEYTWDKPIEVSKPVMLYAFIEGLSWFPL